MGRERMKGAVRRGILGLNRGISNPKRNLEGLEGGGEWRGREGKGVRMWWEGGALLGALRGALCHDTRLLRRTKGGTGGRAMK